MTTLSKRLVDLFLAGFGILVLCPLFLLTALLIKLESPGPVFFRQERIGKNFRPFLIYKFRTMVQDAPWKGGLIAINADPRITGIGKFLRKTKIDELPQLINVLKGEMSFVGPRPEVRQYVELYQRDYRDILSVRPGITDLASIQFRDESSVLSKAGNPQQQYENKVLPEKIRLAKEYINRSSFLLDIALIFKTLFALFSRKSDA